MNKSYEKKNSEPDDNFIKPWLMEFAKSTKFPILSLSSSRMLCITAISELVERVNNFVTFIVNKFRSSLDLENINVLVCL